MKALLAYETEGRECINLLFSCSIIMELIKTNYNCGQYESVTGFRVCYNCKQQTEQGNSGVCAMGILDIFSKKQRPDNSSSLSGTNNKEPVVKPKTSQPSHENIILKIENEDMEQKLDYKKITEDALSQIKHLRDQHATEEWESDYKLVRGSMLFDYGGSDFDEYRFVLEQAKNISYQMVLKIISMMFKIKGIPAELYSDKQDKISCFVVPKDEARLLLIFKEFGLNKRKSKDEITNLLQKYKADSFLYVSYVWDFAYLEVINHNDNINDLTRGSGAISIKDFFLIWFGDAAYSEFKHCIDDYTEEVGKYISILVIKALQPSALFRFKKVTKNKIRTFEYTKIIGDNISHDQIEELEKQFFDVGMYKALVGKAAFAESFLTAEWLYDSFKNAGKIDYTVVALGYFKSIEQLLYAYIELHSEEGRTLKRNFLKDDDKYLKINEKGDKIFDKYVPVNKENIEDGRLDTTIGSMVNSFYCFGKNNDLVGETIERETLWFIRDFMKSIVPLRNGFFHKDNLDKWEMVEEARNCAYLVSFLLLGAYRFTAEDQAILDVINIDGDTHYNKLCEYINAYPQKVYYLYNKETDPLIPFVCSADADYDRYGNCHYGKIRMHPLASKDNFTIDRDKMPRKVVTESLNIMGVFVDGQFDFERLFAGDKTVIYENGEYCGPELDDLSGY